MAGGRGYVTSAVAQINEASARLLVRDIETYAKIRRVNWPQKLLLRRSNQILLSTAKEMRIVVKCI